MLFKLGATYVFTVQKDNFEVKKKQLLSFPVVYSVTRLAILSLYLASI